MLDAPSTGKRFALIGLEKDQNFSVVKLHFSTAGVLK